MPNYRVYIDKHRLRVKFPEWLQKNLPKALLVFSRWNVLGDYNGCVVAKNNGEVIGVLNLNILSDDT